MSDDLHAAEQILDPTEVDRRLGMQSAGGPMQDPPASADTRRRAPGVQNPKPLYRDRECAAEIRSPALD